MNEVSDVYYDSRTSSSEGASFRNSEQMTSFHRELTVYIGEDAAFYDSTGRIVSDSQTQKNTSHNSRTGTATSITKSSWDFSVKVYIGSDDVMLYIDRWKYTYYYKYYDDASDEEAEINTEKDTEFGCAQTVLQKYLHTWIDCSSDPSVAMAFINVNNSNLQTFSKLADIIDSCVNPKDDKKIYVNKGDVYTLKEDAYKKLLGLDRMDDDCKFDFDGQFDIDLGNKRSPRIDYDVIYDLSYNKSELVGFGNDKHDYSNRQNSHLYMYDSLVFGDIDNTVIKFDRKAGADVADINEQAEALYESRK